MELRNRQSRVGSQENAGRRNWQKCCDDPGRSYLEVLTAGGGGDACGGDVGVTLVGSGLGADFLGPFTDFMCAGAFLDFSQFREIQGRVGVDIVHRVPDIRSLWDKEDKENKLQDNERETDVEVVVPAKVGGDRTGDDGNSIRDASEHEIDDRDTKTTLVDEK